MKVGGAFYGTYIFQDAIINASTSALILMILDAGVIGDGHCPGCHFFCDGANWFDTVLAAWCGLLAKNLVFQGNLSYFFFFKIKNPTFVCSPFRHP